MIRVEGLTKVYTSGLIKKTYNKAVDSISFEVESGQTLGLIGESGCGKSTVALMLTKLLEPTSGKIFLNGKDVSRIRGSELKQYHRDVQIIFQNPENALDPRMKIKNSILEAIRNYSIVPKGSASERDLLNELMMMVGLQQEHLDRYPWELSGGQIQRAIIARVIALNPKVLVTDEPTSMLDVSVQAQILTLLKNLQKEHGFAMLFISHDLDVVRAIAEDIIVMNHGQEVERGSVDSVFLSPQKEYTKNLIKAFYYENEDNSGGIDVATDK
ncbi:MAG: ATP-binding cassette domain-containing protein [Eubacteriales bacterium]|nr:ATP-binding cassette domain-containing protein [Eubacteriales bacterium]